MESRLEQLLRDTMRRLRALERPAAVAPTWSNLTLANGWTSQGAPYPVAGWSKSADGIVRLRGLIVAGTTTNGTTLTTLPAGARPGYRHIFLSWPQGQRVDVLPSGVVELNTYTGSAGLIGLDQITFQADQ